MARWRYLPDKPIKFIVRPSFYVFWAVFSLLDNEGILPIFLLAAALHELGHAAAIRCCGGRIAALELSAGGAVLRQEMILPPLASAAVSLAGPAAGAAAAWIGARLGFVTFAGASMLLTLLNCLPLLPLDGGCALLSLLEHMGCGERAERLLLRLSVLGAALLAGLGALLLVRTGRNASVLAVGLCLLQTQRSLLRQM